MAQPEISTKVVPATKVAYVAKKGSYDLIPQAMGEVFGFVARLSVAPAGMPLGVYFNNPRETPVEDLVWELQVPVPPDTSERREGDFGVKAVPERLIAFALHRGPYDSVAPAYDALSAWIAREGYRIAGPPEEAYFTPPGVPPEQIVTEIRFPIAKAS